MQKLSSRNNEKMKVSAIVLLVMLVGSIIIGAIGVNAAETTNTINPTSQFTVVNTGDKFSDNVEIVKKYSQVGSISQVLLSNGEFIEKEIMQGKNPLLLIGKENAPDVITNYIKSSNIQGGVLIGNELIAAATNIRQSTGINVQVKFARSARGNTSGVAPVEGLDLFTITPINVETTTTTQENPTSLKEVNNAPTPVVEAITP